MALVVVKLGGSLQRAPVLEQWLALLADAGGGRVVIVPGGGGFADQVRALQTHWRFDDLAAHNMAVLGMAQMGLLMQGLQPRLRTAVDATALRAVLHGGRCAVWLPLDLLRDAADALTHWGVSADSLALHLAESLHAERLIVVKSCAVEPGASLAAMSEAGVLDAEFATRARGAGCSIDVLQATQLEWARGLIADSA